MSFALTVELLDVIAVESPILDSSILSSFLDDVIFWSSFERSMCSFNIILFLSLRSSGDFCSADNLDGDLPAILEDVVSFLICAFSFISSSRFLDIESNIVFLPELNKDLSPLDLLCDVGESGSLPPLSFV
ncbi:hypothetical protein AWRI1631_46570 [Saccharomyces cerevisiae AWRI1631]|uniref:Uncharacterized protein n=1 Tax=Saccharomyces cerevisiae (strain AWRI1631) TaxID=545124 RepID=B5VGW9_YEAS6|nr:hypothetical protein AWRI1631_46570 [Saccharomyces cerevisiae AWRI1631]